PLYSLFLLLIIPHQLICPLFPYTTLFRSDLDLLQFSVTDEAYEKIPEQLLPLLRADPILSISRADEQVRLTASESDPLGAAAAVDRKSTRLNSSHVAISYAVFCLKKKKSS